MYWELLARIIISISMMTGIISDKQCFEIMPQEELHKMLSEAKLNVVLDGEQLSPYATSNYYYLSDGSVIIVPIEKYKKCNGLLLENAECLNMLLNLERLPVENPEKSFYESRQKQILTINDNLHYFLNHLNNRLNINFISVQDANYINYYEGVRMLYQKNAASENDILALLILTSELVRQHNGGSWILKKIHSVYNPYYQPLILTKDGQIINIEFDLLNMVEYNLKMNNIFFEELLTVSPTANIQIFEDLGFGYILLG